MISSQINKCGSCRTHRRFVIVLVAILLPVIAGLAALRMSPSSGPSKAEAAEPSDAKTIDVLNRAAPELAGIKGWENSKGGKLADLKGQVVVVHFWTFGCINCQRNLPIYNAWQRDFGGKGLQIIGIHTPETADEAKTANIAEQIKNRGIEYPVAVDTEGATWKAFGNRYWPAIYLIDRDGKVRFRWEGELEINNAHGDSIMRQKMKALLAEK